MSDPEVHARLSVVESNVVRIDEEVRDIRDRCTNLEVCAGALPNIEKTLEKLDKKLDNTQIELNKTRRIGAKQAGQFIALIVIFQVILTVLLNNAVREIFFSR